MVYVPLVTTTTSSEAVGAVSNSSATDGSW